MWVITFVVVLARRWILLPSLKLATRPIPLRPCQHLWSRVSDIPRVDVVAEGFVVALHSSTDEVANGLKNSSHIPYFAITHEQIAVQFESNLHTLNTLFDVDVYT